MIGYFLSWLLVWNVLLGRVLSIDPLAPTEIGDESQSVPPTATKGMIIDAGSGGSRLHIFTWKPRVFKKVPPPLSYPEANEKWTARIDPGVHNLITDLSKVADHLAPLIDFAKVTLVGLESEFHNFPIFFKATGGVRELDFEHREILLGEVRRLLSDKNFCPFFFRNDYARVISGEEEAIFSWSATNFLMGTLLPNSEGIGEVLDANSTFGTLDLGGASTQIAFFVPSQDILDGLYKLQIGGQKMWNVYAKSFLEFGAVSARVRHVSSLVDNVFSINGDGSSSNRIINPCFHAGYSEQAPNPSFTPQLIEVTGPSQPSPDQLHRCRDSLRPLMQRELGKLCDEVYHGDCSIGGAYQPPIPQGKHGHFIGTSTYRYPWAFLQLPKTATLQQFEEKAQELCQMNFAEMMLYYESHQTTINLGSDKVTDFLPYYCFLSGYVLTLLEDGYRFEKNQTLTVLDEVNGHRVGWALGAILYEINQLPWILKLSVMETHPYGFVALAATLGFILGLVTSYFVYREIVEGKKSATSPNASGRFSSHGMDSKAMIGLGPGQIPPLAENFEEIRRLTTIDLIRQKQASMSASSDFIPMNISSSGGGVAAGGGGKPVNHWLAKLADIKPFTSTSSSNNHHPTNSGKQNQYEQIL